MYRTIGILGFCASCLGLLLASVSFAAGPWTAMDQSCVLDKWAWRSGLNDKNNIDVLIGAYRGKALYFWMTVKGDAEALEYIKQNKMLPVIITWRSHSGGHVVSPMQEKIVTLSEELIKGLEAECAVDGWWDFRTWDFRNQKGYWIVKPEYPNGNEAACAQSLGKSCVFEIDFTTEE